VCVGGGSALASQPHAGVPRGRVGGGMLDGGRSQSDGSGGRNELASIHECTS